MVEASLLEASFFLRGFVGCRFRCCVPRTAFLSGNGFCMALTANMALSVAAPEGGGLLDHFCSYKPTQNRRPVQIIWFFVGTVRDRVGTVWVFVGTVRDCLKGLRINKPCQTVPNGPYKKPHGPHAVPNGPYKKQNDLHGPSILRLFL